MTEPTRDIPRRVAPAGQRAPMRPSGRRRRRRVAAGGRVAATGVSAGAMLGIIGAIGAHSPPTGATTKLVAAPVTDPPATTATRPTDDPHHDRVAGRAPGRSS